MTLSRDEHIERAEELLLKAEQNLAEANRQDDFRRVEIVVQIAQGHTLLADTKRVTL